MNKNSNEHIQILNSLKKLKIKLTQLTKDLIS